MEPRTRSAPSSPRTPLRGLSAEDAERTVKAYFERFAWEPAAFDPTVLSASQFLERLRD